MNKRISILGLGVLAILVIGTFSFSAFAQDSQLSIIGNKSNSNSDKFIPGQITVGLEKPDPNFNSKASLHGGQVINSIDQINALVIKVPVDTEEKFISAISKNPNVVYAERDAIITATSLDQYHDIQWGLERIGMNDIWDDPSIDPSLGSEIIVAVVDTGIYDNHPDFAGTNILTDLDYDFIDNDDSTRPTTTCGNSAEYHGTFVAGIIAATKDNAIGVAGIGPFDILPVRVLNNCGSGSSSAVANGIIWAADHGAKVINLSLGSSVPSSSIEAAVNYAHGWPADVVIIAASGNSGSSQISYPAGFANTISVGAITNTDLKASYSQYGNTLELAAPGGSSGACSSSGTPYIVSTGVGVRGGSTFFQYQCGTGTSFAAPHASGVAALVKAANPSAENEEIRLHLQQTAEDLGSPGYDIYFGHGLVRADIALSIPINSGEPDTTPPTITVPSGVTLEAPADATPANTGYATATDAVDPSPTISYNDVESLDAQGIGTIARTWIATDDEGNSSSGDQIITIEENSPITLVPIHVGDLDWIASDKKNWNAKVTITVHNATHYPVSNVSVQGTFTGGDIVNCLTDGLGTCQVNKTTRLNELTFTVVSLSGTYFESSNLHHDPDNGDLDTVVPPSVIIPRGSSSGGDPPPEEPPEDPPQDKCTPGMQKKGLC